MSEESIPIPTDADAGAPRPPRNAAKWASRLALVNQIARAAHAKLEMGDLLNTVVEAIHRSFGFYDVSVFLVDMDARECVLVAQTGSFEASGIEGYRQKLGVGIVGWVAEHGETICANDIRTEARRILAFEGEQQFQSELAVPIKLHGETVGIINAQNRETNAFDECDVMALETLSEQIAQTIANAQLFERTRLLRDLNRGIIDAMPSALCVLDSDLKVLYANPQLCRLLAEPPEQISGRHIHDVFREPPPAGEELDGALRDALDNGGTRVFTDTIARFGDAEYTMNVRVAPAQMPEGTGILIVLDDVTEWRRAMELAEARRNQLSMIVDHVPLAVVSIDLEGGVTFWGSGAQRLFGTDESDVVGRQKLYDLVTDADTLGKMIETCRCDNSASGQLATRRDDGQGVPVLAVLGKLFDREEAHVGYTAVLIDITERQRARDELLREKNKLDDVVEVIGAGLALIDRDMKVVWANRTLEDWFGRGESIEGLSCHQLYCRRDTMCTICPSRTCFNTGSHSESEVALVRADGQLRQYHHAVTPVVGPTGEVDQVLKLSLDVTDQTKKVYQLSRLRQLGELMQGLLDLDRLLHFVLTCVTAGQAMGFNRAVLMLIDEARNVVEGKMGVGPGSAEEAGRIWSDITESAPTFEDLLAQYDRDQLDAESAMNRIGHGIRVSLDDRSHVLAECALGMKPIIVTNAEQDPRVPPEFRQSLGCNNFVLVPLITRNRTVGIVMADNLYSGQPISEEHVELLGMFAPQAAIAIENAENYARLQEEKSHVEKAYRDLADAQDKMVRSERLVAIGRMAAHVAHEIRNPLVTIGGFAKLIQDRPEARDKDVSRYAQIIASEVSRLENILARVMDFSKPPRPLLRETVLDDVIRETVDQLRDRAEAQQVSVSLRTPQHSVRLLLDPEQVKQVVINLVQNALDVMKDGGELSVDVETSGTDALVHVTNSGDLIRPEHMPNLFEPFFSTRPGGTGLGLAVSQKIIQEHGGDITVISTLTTGTRFTIRLPLIRQE